MSMGNSSPLVVACCNNLQETAIAPIETQSGCSTTSRIPPLLVFDQLPVAALDQELRTEPCIWL